jgi:hypothetical protein
VSRAVFQIRNIGYPAIIFLTPKQIDMIFSHLSLPMLSRFLRRVQAIAGSDRGWPAAGRGRMPTVGGRGGWTRLDSVGTRTWE